MYRFIKPRNYAVWAAIVALAFVLTIGLGGCFSQQNLWIAVPLNENNSGDKNLQEVINSIQMYVDEVNQAGGVNGKQLKVKQVNDQGTVAGARTAARRIAQDNRELAVIGSFNSFLSIAAGEIYREFGIPAVTGSSTAEVVTQGNDWYFRVTFDNFLQGKFLAYYINKVLKQSSAIVIYDPQEPYSNSLAESFTNEQKQLGGKIAQEWTIYGEAQNLDEQVASIATEIKKFQKDNSIDAVVIPTLETVAAKLIVALKHEGITSLILGGDTLGNQTFLGQFKDYPEEKLQPGYFTDGIIATVPAIFDILGEESQAFKSAFKQKYGTEPTHVGALYYDTAKVVVAAMQQAGVQGNPANIAEERGQIKAALAAINSKKKAIAGITGPIYFNREHNAVRPVAIGILEQQQLVSAFVQLTPILSLQNQQELEQEVRAGDIVSVGEQYLYKTDVIPTGIEVDQISNLNLDDKTCTLDFNIWFRYQNLDRVAEEVKNVEFINALERVKLKEPLVETKMGDIHYQLYKIRGKFQVDFLPEYKFGQHNLGISFLNKNINHNNLVYVTDVVGLSREGLQRREQEPWRKMEILSPTSGWKITRTLFFQDLVTKDAQGNPNSLSSEGQQAKFSRLNLALTITENKVNFRRILPISIATYLTIVSGIIFGFIFVSGKTEWFKLSTKWIWILQALSVLLLLWSIETVLIYWLGRRDLDSEVMELAVTGFSILWWLVPCFILNLAIQDFIWVSLEKSTQQNVPTLLRRLVSVVVYLFAVFGIVAYVFHQPITSLLGASGLFLTIIGLAIQINISNVFSGLAINLEKAVRVGDYIELPEKKIIGYVHDINWRATRILSLSGNIVLVPNSEINNQTIVNYALPNKLSNADIVLCLEHAVSPEQATAVLLEAVKMVCDTSINSPLSQPEPCVLVSNITLDGVEYWIRCWFVAGETTLSLVKNVVTRSVLEHLQRAGLKLAESSVIIMRENELPS